MGTESGTVGGGESREPGAGTNTQQTLHAAAALGGPHIWFPNVMPMPLAVVGSDHPHGMAEKNETQRSKGHPKPGLQPVFGGSMKPLQ